MLVFFIFALQTQLKTSSITDKMSAMWTQDHSKNIPLWTWHGPFSWQTVPEFAASNITTPTDTLLKAEMVEMLIFLSSREKSISQA